MPSGTAVFGCMHVRLPAVSSPARKLYLENIYDEIVAFLVASLACVPLGVSVEEDTDQPDQLSQMLFDTYLVHGRMVNTSTMMAASHIVAERGRNTGYWREVLAELRKGKEQNEIGCVQVLGKMLAIDAAAHDVIRREKETGEIGQWRASVALGSEVVAERVSRGEKADRFRADHYAIALARARVPDAINFFRMILRDEGAEHHLDSTKFHAALGLAQLGDATGFDWMIAHSADMQLTVSNPSPAQVSNANRDTCCTAALQQLSGNKDLRTMNVTSTEQAP